MHMPLFIYSECYEGALREKIPAVRKCHGGKKIPWCARIELTFTILFRWAHLSAKRLTKIRSPSSFLRLSLRERGADAARQMPFSFCKCVEKAYILMTGPLLLNNCEEKERERERWGEINCCSKGDNTPGIVGLLGIGQLCGSNPCVETNLYKLG